MDLYHHWHQYQVPGGYSGDRCRSKPPEGYLPWASDQRCRSRCRGRRPGKLWNLQTRGILPRQRKSGWYPCKKLRHSDPWGKHGKNLGAILQLKRQPTPGDWTDDRRSDRHANEHEARCAQCRQHHHVLAQQSGSLTHPGWYLARRVKVTLYGKHKKNLDLIPLSFKPWDVYYLNKQQK